MKTITRRQRVDVSDDTKVSNFSVEISPQIFDLIVNKMYSNKIATVMREIGCNAYDSHVANGNAEQPFTVHLPNNLEPYFYIRDYGTGLSPDEIYSLYTRLGASTKRESNDFTGCLGIGSKSPFCYQDNFTVTSYYNGEQNVYSCYIGEEGIPQVAELSIGTETDEPNGLKVQIAVPRSDFHLFQSYTQEIYQYFRIKPEIIGSSISIKEIEYRLKGETWKLRDAPHSNQFQTRAVMGNVAYPITIDGQHLTSDQQALLRCPLDIEFAIGDLQVSGDREALQYDKRTIFKLKEKLDTVIEELTVCASESIQNAKNIHEARLAFLGLNKVFPLALVRLMQARQVKFKGKEVFPNNYNYEVDLPQFKSDDTSVLHFWRDIHSWRTTPYRSEARRITYKTNHPLIFVEDDLGTGAISRAKYLAETDSDNPLVCLLSFGNKQDKKNILNTIGIDDSYLVPASGLAKPPSAKRSRRSGYTSTKVQLYSGCSNYQTHCWANTETDLSEGGIYVPIVRGKYILDKVQYHPKDLQHVLSGIKSITDESVKLFGLKRAIVKQAHKKGEWTHLKDYAHKVLKDNPLNYADIIQYKRELDYVNGGHYLFKTFRQVVKHSKTDNELVQFIEKCTEYEDMAKQVDKAKAYKRLAEWSGFDSKVKTKKIDSLQKYLESLLNKYPLLKVLDPYFKYTTEELTHLALYLDTIYGV